jgi:hypothetical protein
MREVEPALEDVPEDRAKKVSELLWKEWDFKPGSFATTAAAVPAWEAWRCPR